MFRKIFSTVLLLSAVLSFCSCREEGGNGKIDKLIVGFDAGFPPYGYVENGKYVGFDLDLAREVARRNNWKLELKPINWKAKDAELNSGSINCIWNGFTINGRENDYEWSSPYVDNSQVVMVNASSKITAFSDLTGKAVAVQTDTPVQKALQSGGAREEFGKKIRLITVANYNNAVMELESGSVSAVAMDIGVAQEKMKSGNFRILSETLITEKYGIGFKKGNTVLRDAVQKTLVEMVKDGSAAEISAKYFNGKNVLIITEKDVPARYAGEKTKVDVFDVKLLFPLLKGLGVSIAIFVLTLVFSLPLGMVIAAGRLSSNILLSSILKVYISIMRGTPLMLQLFVWFFAPYYLFGIRLADLSFCGIDYRFTAVIIGFSLNYAAYFAEIYRGGILSVPRGQYEAAYVLGYSKSATFFRIILPQVIKRIISPVTNEVITLVKDTSLAFALAVVEMFTVASEIASAQSSMVPLAVAGLFYYIFNFAVAGVMAAVEKKLNYYR